ncbi:hypothetical protein [Rhodococcoides fascians]|uniref:hypothetical protein n=1 Tax=Rhodococcoides fascians TaxID=1828 RepID=UPI00050C8152|nr:hypothetical protein [Rhodococcus fascians]
MQTVTVNFDDHPEELYFTLSDGNLSIGSETRSIGSVFVGVLEPEATDVVQTEPIVEPEPEPENDDEESEES